MTPSFPDDTAALRTGAIPLLGFGTWQLRSAQAVDAVTCALEAGYRHLDTATIYDNESEVGAAVAKSGLDRKDVFITTKVPAAHSGRAEQTLEQSLTNLGTDRVDLWLIHWPPDAGADVEMWRALVRARDAGLATDIGVSNHSLEQIDELEHATGVPPAVNQIKWSPLLFDAAVLDGHRHRGVVVEGYSALRGGALTHPVIRQIAQSRDVSPAQVIIRWHLQHEVVVIPKSATPERIRANADVSQLHLSTEEMTQLDNLAQR